MPEHPEFAARLRAALTTRQVALLRDLGAQAAAAGTPAFLIGGVVRDMLLGGAIDDLDIAVVGDAHALGHTLASHFGGDLVLHDSFGTANWRPPNGEDVDLVTARSEVYPEPAALPVVTPSTLDDDLARRDFTINAMALSLSPERWAVLIDPFNGRDDLRAGLVRILHPDSFIDDPTRTWRAARFCARLGFQLAEATRRSLDAARDSGALSRLGLERLGNELKYALHEAAAVRALALAQSWGLLHQLHPALSEPDLLTRLEATRSAAGDHAEEACWLTLSEHLPDSARTTLVRVVPGGGPRRKRWLSSPERAARSLPLLDAATLPSDAAMALRAFDAVELAYLAGRLSEPQQRWLTWWRSSGQHIRCAVDGRALMSAGIPRGPLIGRALHAAQLAAWNGADAAGQQRAAQAASAPPAQ